jgi:hypothetical protein
VKSEEGLRAKEEGQKEKFMKIDFNIPAIVTGVLAVIIGMFLIETNHPYVGIAVGYVGGIMVGRIITLAEFKEQGQRKNPHPGPLPEGEGEEKCR